MVRGRLPPPRAIHRRRGWPRAGELDRVMHRIAGEPGLLAADLRRSARWPMVWPRDGLVSSEGDS